MSQPDTSKDGINEKLLGIVSNEKSKFSIVLDLPKLVNYIATERLKAKIEELENMSMEVVEPCEPDCSDVRHALHEGSWNAHLKIDNRITELETELNKLEGKS